MQNYAASIPDHTGEVTGVQQSAVLASLIRQRTDESSGRTMDTSMQEGHRHRKHEYGSSVALEHELQTDTDISLKCMLEAGMELHISLVP